MMSSMTKLVRNFIRASRAVCGVAPACPTINAAGVATLSNVSFPGISAGIFAGAIQANFAGDANYAPTGNTGTLTVFPALIS